MLLVWILVFAISLAVLVKGADWLLRGAEGIGTRLGIPHFIVGVTLVALGTSLPELFSSIVAVMEGVNEVVAANVIGSNIANILLIIGISSIFARTLSVSKDLIDLDLPLLATATSIFLVVAWDKDISTFESAILLFTYLVYTFYLILYREGDDIGGIKHISFTKFLRREKGKERVRKGDKRISWKDFALTIGGTVGLILGAKYLIESVIELSQMLNISEAIIAITAVAIGTSLPELLVSIKAAMKRNMDVALGNIFGSNIFNMMVVIGVPGTFAALPVDDKTFTIGLPVMVLATFLFVISGISKKIHIWEGAMYVLLYFIFIGKLFDFL